MAKPLKINERKTKSYRELGPVDITALREAVAAMPAELWDEENKSKPNRFETLNETRHVVFRFLENFRDWRTSHDRPLWAEWRGVLEPVLAQATADYGYSRGEFPRVMLARMPAGGRIEPHVDGNPAAKWPHKIHVPIVTNDKVTFFVDRVGRHLPEGQAVEVNNMAPHGVTNDGESDRIHLIFEYFDLDQPPPPWVDKLRPPPGAASGAPHAAS